MIAIPIDWIALSLIVIFSITGLFNGFAKELFSLAAWFLSIYIAWTFGQEIFPYLEGYIDNVDIRKVASFVLLFLSFFLTFKFVGSMLSKTLSTLGLGGVDKIFGAMFGGLKIALAMSTICLLNLDYLGEKDWWNESLAKEGTLFVEEYLGPLLSEWDLDSEKILNKENINPLL